MLRNTFQTVAFNGSTYQLDYTQSAYLRLHLRSVRSEGFTVTQAMAHRPDLVAVEAYGEPENWWVIAFYNGIVNPQRELEAGRYLDIPDKGDVENILQNVVASIRPASRIGNKVQV